MVYVYNLYDTNEVVSISKDRVEEALKIIVVILSTFFLFLCTFRNKCWYVVCDADKTSFYGKTCYEFSIDFVEK